MRLSVPKSFSVQVQTFCSWKLIPSFCSSVIQRNSITRLQSASFLFVCIFVFFCNLVQTTSSSSKSKYCFLLTLARIKQNSSVFSLVSRCSNKFSGIWYFILHLPLKVQIWNMMVLHNLPQYYQENEGPEVLSRTFNSNVVLTPFQIPACPTVSRDR